MNRTGDYLQFLSNSDIADEKLNNSYKNNILAVRASQIYDMIACLGKDNEDEIIMEELKLCDEEINKYDSELNQTELCHYTKRLKRFTKEFKQYRRRRSKLSELLSTRLVDPITISRNMKMTSNVNTSVDVNQKSEIKYKEEDKAKLYEENMILMSKFKTEEEEVRLLEVKAQETAELIEQFSTTVMEQHETIGEISMNLEDTQFHLEKGNKYLEKTIEYNSNSRFVMFVYTMLMTFSVLFLNWYNR